MMALIAASQFSAHDGQELAPRAVGLFGVISALLGLLEEPGIDEAATANDYKPGPGCVSRT